MAVTRQVRQAKQSDLPADDENHVGFVSDGHDGYGRGEDVAIPDNRIFIVTKPINFDQLIYDLNEALGVPVQVAASQPPTKDDRIGPVPGSKENPLTVYVKCEDFDESATRTISSILDEHQADDGWKHPALTG